MTPKRDPRLFRVAKAVAEVARFVGDLPVLQKIGLTLLTAAGAGLAALWILVRPLLPSTPGAWVAWALVAILCGLGVVFALQKIPRVYRQLLAPNWFRDLPREHKHQLVEVLRLEPDAWRTNRSAAIYVDLQRKGLIRDVADLASNQAMVRLTPVGRALAEEWDPRESGREGPRGSDRRPINDLRTIWNRHGDQAVRGMLQLLTDAQNGAQEIYWTRALAGPIQRLDDSITDLREGLHLSSPLVLAEVRERFNEMYRRYMDATRWVAEMHEAGDTVGASGSTSFEERLEWWRRDHFLFQYRLGDLNEHVDHYRTIRCHYRTPGVAFESPAFAQLISSAENGDRYAGLLVNRAEDAGRRELEGG